jgi:hypothetical protein
MEHVVLTTADKITLVVIAAAVVVAVRIVIGFFQH